MAGAEMSFPKQIRPHAPPIKTQGIKTKLTPFILSSISWNEGGRWVEPFLGSGAVAFNAAPKNALLADSNKHIVAFYNAVQCGDINAARTREYLLREGKSLERSGGEHYYAIRNRFNEKGEPLDFLFLNRACFNGVMRFNSKGGFNVPFCKKPDRFRPAYITKICNQIDWVAKLSRQGSWSFVCQDWRVTLSDVRRDDFAYIDPPYVGRHTDFFGSWDDEEADQLAGVLHSLPCGFAYSMWEQNKYRKNAHLEKWFSSYPTARTSHFYHVGSTEDLRNEMIEALVVSPANCVVSAQTAIPERELQESFL
jgi:DNA adenine methylase